MDTSVIYDFYILEELSARVRPRPGNMAQERLAREVSAELARLTSDLALAMRDYCFVAAIGEARHAHSHCVTEIPDIPHNSGRTGAYMWALEYSPAPSADALIDLFSAKWDKSSFGGMPWRGIAEAVKKFDELPTKAFVDYCWSLKHNGGPMFNKPEVRSALNWKLSLSSDTIQDILNRKAEGSLIDSLRHNGYHVYYISKRVLNFFVRWHTLFLQQTSHHVHPLQVSEHQLRDYLSNAPYDEVKHFKKMFADIIWVPEARENTANPDFYTYEPVEWGSKVLQAPLPLLETEEPSLKHATSMKQVEDVDLLMLDSPLVKAVIHAFGITDNWTQEEYNIYVKNHYASGSLIDEMFCPNDPNCPYCAALKKKVKLHIARRIIKKQGLTNKAIESLTSIQQGFFAQPLGDVQTLDLSAHAKTNPEEAQETLTKIEYQPKDTEEVEKKAKKAATKKLASLVNDPFSPLTQNEKKHAKAVAASIIEHGATRS